MDSPDLRDNSQRWQIVPLNGNNYTMNIKFKRFDRKDKKLYFKSEQRKVKFHESKFISNLGSTEIVKDIVMTESYSATTSYTVKIGISPSVKLTSDVPLSKMERVTSGLEHKAEYTYEINQTKTKSLTVSGQIKIAPYKSVKCTGWYDYARCMQIPVKTKVSITATGSFIGKKIPFQYGYPFDDGSFQHNRPVYGTQLKKYLQQNHFSGKISEVNGYHNSHRFYFTYNECIPILSKSFGMFG